MDFKRVQVLLLIFFLLFDIYLLVILVSRIEADVPTTAPINVSIDNELRNRGVVFESLSSAVEDLPLIQTHRNNYLKDNLMNLENQTATMSTEDKMVSTFNEPLDLGIGLSNQTLDLNEEQVQVLMNNFLKKPNLFLKGDQYQYYRYSGIERTIYFRMNAYDNYKIVDGTAEIKLVLNDQYQLTSYSQSYQEDIKPLDTLTTIISESDALEVIDGRVETYIPDNSRIEHIRLSYYRMTQLEEYAVYSPVWEVLYTQPDGKVRLVYVEASRGTILIPG